MLTDINPKLPMRNQSITREYYVNQLGFKEIGTYENYLIVQKDHIEIHFFEHKNLNPKENYGQVYIRTNNIEQFYQLILENKTEIHPNGALKKQPWGQIEFALLDPDNNLLTFGQAI
jgi:hypothetical protein